VATCPHCFNTLANEYPQLGGHYEVVHHTQLLSSLIADGHLVPVMPVDSSVTYHDPCYLGRHNKVYTPPREVLGAIQGLAPDGDAPVQGPRLLLRCRRCADVDGEKIGKAVNVERVDEALSTNADVVSTACPFCMVMLGDAVDAKKASGEAQQHVEVLDVAQILAKSLVKPEVITEPAVAATAPAADAAATAPAP
jgi:Fe-S oxidoreductase